MTYKGALIGCGYISEMQLEAWQAVLEAQIVAVCDLDEAKARQRADQFGIRGVYTDYRQMLDSQALDFVDIATRPDSHPEMVRESAARSLHVLCQKPLAESMEACREMVEVCRDAEVQFMVNENGRHQAWFRHLRALIDEGALGTVHNAQFHGRWQSTLPTPDFEGQPFFAEMPRLLVFEMGVHYLDIARYLLGEAQTVYARLGQVSPHVVGEDQAVLVVQFGPATCVIDSNWYAYPEPAGEAVTWGRTVLEGTHGTAILETGGNLKILSADGEQATAFPKDTVPRSFQATQQHFIDCLADGREPETSGRETLKTMALVFGAYRSADEGRVVSMAEYGPP